MGCQLNLPPERICATQRDRISSNGLACRTLSTMLSNAANLECFAHTLDHVGKNMNSQLVTDFMSHLHDVWASYKGAALWRDFVGTAPP